MLPSDDSPNLDVLAFSITNACNLNCSFCARDAKAGGNRHLEVEIIVRASREALSQWKPRTISVTGGEPLCHPQVFIILEELHAIGAPLRMNTNCTLITEEIAARLRDNGVKQVTVSIDSLRPAINERIGRGREYMAAVESAIRYLKDCGIAFFVKCTLNDHNLSEVGSILDYALSADAIGFAVGRTVPIGRGKGNMNGYLLPYRRYRDICRMVVERIPGRFKFLIDDPLKHFWDPRITRHLKADGFDGSRLRGGCMAGVTMLYVLPSGDVLACPALPVPAGNLHNQSLEEIWRHSELLLTLRNRELLEGLCRNCERREFCGGCRGAAYAVFGSVLADDPACPHLNAKPV